MTRILLKLVCGAACRQLTLSFPVHQCSVIKPKRNAGFSIRSVLKMLVGVSVVGVLINIHGSAHGMWKGEGGCYIIITK